MRSSSLRELLFGKSPGNSEMLWTLDTRKLQDMNSVFVYSLESLQPFFGSLSLHINLSFPFIFLIDKTRLLIINWLLIRDKRGVWGRFIRKVLSFSIFYSFSRSVNVLCPTMFHKIYQTEFGLDVLIKKCLLFFELFFH